MNTVSIARRAAMTATLTLAFFCGVVSTTPVVLANCGTQNGGPTCKENTDQPDPSDVSLTADDELITMLFNALRVWIY